MALLIGFEPEGLPPKVANAFDNLIAPLQTWAGKVDGLNTAERLALLTTGLASVQSVPTGAIFMWGTNTAPTGYLICDGSSVGRTTYPTLFALWGLTFGAGSGANTFALPDMRQRFPLGKAASGTGSTLAGTGGAIDHTHTGPSHTHTGPSHTHSFSGTSSSNGSHDHGGSTNDDNATDGDYTGGGAKTGPVSLHDHGISSDGSHTHTTSGTTGAEGTGNTGASGTGATGSGNPPYLVLNYIVKT